MPGFPGGSPAATASLVGGHGIELVAPPPQLLTASASVDGGYYAPNILREVPPPALQSPKGFASFHRGRTQAISRYLFFLLGKVGAVWVDASGVECCWLGWWSVLVVGSDVGGPPG